MAERPSSGLAGNFVWLKSRALLTFLHREYTREKRQRTCPFQTCILSPLIVKNPRRHGAERIAYEPALLWGLAHLTAVKREKFTKTRKILQRKGYPVDLLTFLGLY